MPRGDGTGPMGYGSMTGRGAGYCAGYATPGYANDSFGMGMGRGRGFGRGRIGHGYSSYMPYQGYYTNMGTYQVPVYNEKEVLVNQIEFFEKQLQQVRDQLKGFEDKE